MKNKLIVVLLLVAVLSLTLCACTLSNTYEIKFVDDNGNELATVNVEEGGEVVYGGETPTKASTAEFDYAFAGWTDADGIALDKLPAATAAATYKARFTSTKRSYEVKFVNGETTLQSGSLEYGAKIVYNGQVPAKDATAAETYEFVGWALSQDGETVDIGNATVSGNITYYAVFGSTAVKYSVTWIVGATSSQTNVDYNTTPAYEGTPTKAATSTARYEFEGWSLSENGEIVNLADEKIVANTTYYAVFTEVRTHFAVKFVNGETELQNELVAKDAAPVYKGTEPTKAMTESEVFAFVGWAKSQGGEAVDLTKETITADGVVYYAVFTSSARMYDVYWKNGTETKSTKVAYNTAPAYEGTPEKAATNIAKYEFTGWSLSENGEIVDLAEQKITSEGTTYYAVFTEVRTHFAVKFVNGETELQNELVAKDAAPVYNGETPAKASDETYDYTFEGWSKTDDDKIVDLTAESITADGIVYHAVFKATYRIATVTWHVRGEQTTSELKYGDMLAYNGALSIADYEDEDYNYAFKGWSTTENGETVQLDEIAFAADIDVYAVFTATIKQVTLTINYVVEGSDEAITSKELTLDKYTIYGKDTVDAAGVTTLTADKSGYLADQPWVAGRLTSNATVTVTYRVADVWDGTVAEGYASGTGTEADPYVIETGAQLAYLSEQSRQQKDFGKGKYFKLAANIDLGNHEWTPICQRAKTTSASGWLFFAGNFDGQGHIIKLKISSGIGVGLFEGFKGTVSNLTITGLMSVKNRCGAIAYMLGDGGKVENCKNYATIKGSATGAVYVGGLIGATNQTTGSIINCVNYGDISSSGNAVAGICGGEISSSITYQGCTNYGTITSTGTKVAGIVGDATTSNIQNCANYGNVSCGQMNAGGIVGSTKTTTVTGCANYGEVLYTGSGGEKHKGFAGIAGWVTTNSTISDCNNYGHVNGYSNVGGIAGYLGAGSTLDDACQNFGKIEGHDSFADIVGANAN